MSNRAILMSIKPKYADLIFAGAKTIELRRVCPKVGPGDLVLVYVSSPRMALVGGFEVVGIVSGDPLTLGKKWLTKSGVEKETFLHYFQGAATAYGILIGRTWQFESATELKALRRRNGGFQSIINAFSDGAHDNRETVFGQPGKTEVTAYRPPRTRRC